MTTLVDFFPIVFLIVFFYKDYNCKRITSPTREKMLWAEFTRTKKTYPAVKLYLTVQNTSQKVSLPFNEVSKELSVFCNYWENAFCFLPSYFFGGLGGGLNPLLAFADLCYWEEAAKNAKTLIILWGGKYKFNGNLSFVMSHSFIDVGRQDELIEDTHVISSVSISLSQFPSIPLPSALLKRVVRWHLFD